MAHIACVSFTYILEMRDQNGTSLFYHYTTPIVPLYCPCFKLFLCLLC